MDNADNSLNHTPMFQNAVLPDGFDLQDFPIDDHSIVKDLISRPVDIDKAEETYSRQELKEKTSRKLGMLSAKKEFVIRALFGLHNAEGVPMRLAEVGEILKMAASDVGVLRDKAFRDLLSPRIGLDSLLSPAERTEYRLEQDTSSTEEASLIEAALAIAEDEQAQELQRERRSAVIALYKKAQHLLPGEVLNSLTCYALRRGADPVISEHKLGQLMLSGTNPILDSAVFKLFCDGYDWNVSDIIYKGKFNDRKDIEAIREDANKLRRLTFAYRQTKRPESNHSKSTLEQQTP